MSLLRVIPFGTDLIDEIAGIIEEEDADGQIIVFPGKRPSLYLKARLTAASGAKAFFPPRCFSLDGLIDHIARRRNPVFTDIDRADAVWLVFGLIRSLKVFDNHPFSRKGFGDFFHWGRHLLNFIDRLDMEGIDNNALINVEKNASIGYDVPQSVNELLSNISLIRGEFHDLLQENGWFTRGTKHIAAVEEIRNEVPADLRRVIFGGLFGLTGGERKVVKSFWDSGRATVVLCGNPDEWPVLKDLVSYLKATAEYKIDRGAPLPSVHVHAGLDAHAEVLEAYRIVTEGARKKTAIVLPVADPLFPLLNFVVDRTDRRCNVSLGHPVERTSLFDLTRHILNARIERRPDGQYPAGEYLDVVLHPFIKNLAPESDLRGLLLYVERSLTGETGQSAMAGKPLTTLDQIEAEAAAWAPPSTSTGAAAALCDIHRLFFRSFVNVSTVREMASGLEEALEAILLRTPVRSYVLSDTIFESFFGALASLRGALFSSARLSADPAQNTRAICDITLDYLGSGTLPFDTHPVEELEVIGMLESRSISFERVIILDVNEGVLPGPREVNPVVPLGVFETLGIPPPEFTEAIYRYNFYRLVGSAAEVHLVYRGSDDRPRSRYIEELLWKEEKAQGRLDVIPVRQTVLPVNLKRDKLPPVIEKTDAAMRALKTNFLSPSAVDTYVRCPLLYYFTRLMGLEERRTFSGDIEATDRGTIIHSILHETFRPFLRFPLAKDMEDEVRKSLDNALKSHFKNSPGSGEFYLFQRIAAYKLDSFLRRHLKTLSEPLIIEHLEERFRADVKIKGDAVTLFGRIDRVDRSTASGRYTVIDYKTGTARQYPSRIMQKADFGDIKSIHDYVPSFQLPIYMHIFSTQESVPLHSMDAGLFLLGSNSEETFFKGKDELEDKRLLDAYTQGIETVLSHMFDPNEPFSAFDTSRCMDCPARNLCHV
ncbi:MAG: PD-(D/E)XK nuclease family protein [Syntrophorhabdaceae bacterium]|nr:PD-(D/E)XK nuclease family protein [Syntrophorhabdaceae bacterium]